MTIPPKPVDSDDIHAYEEWAEALCDELRGLIRHVRGVRDDLDTDWTDPSTVAGLETDCQRIDELMDVVEDELAQLGGSTLVHQIEQFLERGP